MTMVEKVARALFTRKVEEFVCDGTWEENAALHEDFMQDARAAIEAMREPTRGMVEDGYAALMDWDARTGEDKGISDTWVAMINAALSEEVSE